MDTTQVAKPFKCVDCYKSFTQKKNLNAHRPICPRISHPSQCPNCKKILSCAASKSRHMKICQEVVEQIAEQDTTTNHLGFEPLRQFGEERLDHITPEFLTFCLVSNPQRVEVAKLLEAIHFHRDVPENYNIRIQSLKQKMLHVWQNNAWVVETLDDVVAVLVDRAVAMLQAHYQTQSLPALDWAEYDGRIIRHLRSVMAPKNYYSIRRILSAAFQNLPRVRKEK